LRSKFKQPITQSCFASIAGARLALSSAFLFSFAQAMIWYVSSKNGSDASDGRTPSTAFKTLQHAVDVAKAGDTIQIAPGAYDQDLPARVSAARAANIVVAVAGSE
jgi:uncharacterized protein DUF1565